MTDHHSPAFTARRVEDPRLITGVGAYVPDLRLPGLLHLAFVRSPYAHARIASADTSAATRAPGVVKVVTGHDVAQIVRTAPSTALPGMSFPPRSPLAGEVARWVGAPVAAVVAETRSTAEDGARLVDMEYDPLPAVASAESALADGAPLIYPDSGTNAAFRFRVQEGSIESAFELPRSRRIRQRMVLPRLAAVPLESHGCLASFEGGSLTVWSSTQSPFRARAVFAAALGIAPDRVRVVAPDVGGAFGVKGTLTDEEVVVAFAAMQIGRPVNWVATRSEEFTVAHHGRDAVADVEGAFRPDGRLLALRARVLVNVGAQPQGGATIPPTRLGKLLTGTYQPEGIDVEVVGVYTNTPPTGAYRGAGRPEAAYLIERLMDLASAELGVPPAEIRRRNFIPKDKFPYTTLTGLTYDSGDYELALDRALELFHTQERAPSVDGRLRGVGLATYVEPSAGGWEASRVQVAPDGSVTVTVGSTNQGQGHRTVFRDLVAEHLGLDPEQVVVRQGDTAELADAIGTFGSRSLVLAGSGLTLASTELIGRGREIAAGLLEASVDDVQYHDGAFIVAGVPDTRAGWPAVACRANPETGITADATFETPGETFGFGAYVVAVAVEPETGQVSIERFVAVDDCGNVINPVIAAGQVHGGIAQGLGQALMEEVVFDEEGQLLTGSLLDYAAPRAADMPHLELDHTVTPTPLNPLGAKGLGESGTVGTPPAIVNAVVDALRPLGIRHLDPPLTAERVWSAIQAARRDPRPSTKGADGCMSS